MSDIFKRQNALEKTSQPGLPKQIPLPTVVPKKEENLAKEIPEPPKISCAKPLGFTGIMQKKNEIPLPSSESQEACVKIYHRCLEAVTQVVWQAKRKEKITLENLLANVDALRASLEENRDSFIELAYNSPGQAYPDCHLVNVLVLVLIVGKSLDYNREHLLSLGLSALIYDLGMVYFEDLTSLNRKLNSVELKKISGHLQHSAEIFKKTGYLADAELIAKVILEHHERIDGSGYPGGLKGSLISEMARLIGTVDVFEALTHARPWRKRMLAFDAIKEMLDKKMLYDQKTLKALVDTVTIYPPGSWVLLNTDDFGRVAKLNIGLPLRPILEIWRDSQGNICEDKKIIDLTKNPALFIKRALESQDQ